MQLYLGYMTRVCGRPATWEGLFAVAPARAFVQWHSARLQCPISRTSAAVVEMLAAIAKVIEHPNACALADFCKSLPTPEPVHTKRAHWVDLPTLDRVAEACLAAGRVPVIHHGAVRHLGLTRACRFQCGLMLKLLVRIPLRQRNLRELEIGRNLYQDQATGHWHLHFRGSELKVGTRNGRTNEYHVDLTAHHPTFIPPLEEFLTTYRPLFPRPTTSPLLFVTQYGNPFSQRALRHELSSVVARHTGQRFYPQMIRTIWATEFLQKTGDFTTAAVVLGDTLAVTMRSYYDVVHKNQHAKAAAFLSEVLQHGSA